jgi:hypothetical protein
MWTTPSLYLPLIFPTDFEGLPSGHNHLPDLQRCEETQESKQKEARCNRTGEYVFCSPTAGATSREARGASGVRGPPSSLDLSLIFTTDVVPPPLRMSFCPRSALGARQHGTCARAQGVWQHFRIPQRHTADLEG